MQSGSDEQTGAEQKQQEPMKVCPRCGNCHRLVCASQPTTLVWPYGGKQVYVVGDWTRWQKHQPMHKVDSLFVHDINLKIGVYRYKFIVDGKWVYDANKPNESDTINSRNNILEVLPMTVVVPPIEQQDQQADTEKVVKITSKYAGQDVKIIGSWDNWAVQRKMSTRHIPIKCCDQSFIEIPLEVGKRYEYKFKVGGDYCVDDSKPTIINTFGTYNNLLVVRNKMPELSPKAPSSDRAPSQIAREIEPKKWKWQKVQISGFPGWIFGHSLSALGEQIYIFGGKIKMNFSNKLIKLQRNNLKDLEFISEGAEIVAEVPPRAFHSSLFYGNKLIIYGGCGQNQVLTDYYTYVTQQNTWLRSNVEGNPRHKREKGSCVLYEELMIFFGGYYLSSDMELETFYNDIDVLDLRNMVWKTDPHIQGPPPCPRFSHTANIYNDEMVVFGGEYMRDKNVNDVWKLNLNNIDLAWEEIKPKGTPPEPRHGHTANILQHYLIVFGGIGDQLKPFNDLKILDLKNYQWIHPIVEGNTPSPRYFHAMTALVDHKQLIMFGGRTANKRSQHIYVLKPSVINLALDVQ